MPFRFTRHDFRGVINGRTNEIRITQAPKMRKGRSYSVKIVTPAVINDLGEETVPSITKDHPLRLRITEKPVHVGDAWLIRFEIDRDEPVRLLTPAARPHGSERGYTSQSFHALQDSGEAVDDETLKRFAKDAEERHLEHRLSEGWMSSRQRRVMSRKKLS